MNPTQPELDGALQAVLFASGAPVPKEKLAFILEAEKDEIDAAAGRVAALFDSENYGFELITVEDSLQLCTKPSFAAAVKKALETRKTPPLSNAALEALAVISYNQPVTKTFIETVRGVDSDGVVNSLCEKGLVKVCGQLDAPGKPSLFATTENFLRCFGLESLKDLPKIEPQDQIALLDEKEQFA